MNIQGAIKSFVGDRVLFGQAIFNLLENATKFSSVKSAIVIKVSMANTDIDVRIIDDGVGISAADRARVFEKFYSGKPSLSGQSGAGLGLAIVKAVVEAMGGGIEIAARTSAQTGTTMIVRLPSIAAAPASEAPE